MRPITTPPKAQSTNPSLLFLLDVAISIVALVERIKS
jgi:hypothetical protein